MRGRIIGLAAACAAAFADAAHAGSAAAEAAAPAKALFGAAATPAPGAPSPIGAHAKGCLAGAVALPESGPGWQAVRLGRNRNWGHPAMIDAIGRLAARAQALGWPGLHVGDVSQPRGGPMRTGHSSHQIGLDADIWLTRPESIRLSRKAREEIGAVTMVAKDRASVSGAWTGTHAALIRAAAETPGVARIFVNAAIKAELCRGAGPADEAWLRRVRPWWGHDAHMHVRLACPADAPSCVDQDPPPAGAGCGEELAWWFSDEALNPPKPEKPAPPKPPLALADLPPACAGVLGAR